MYGHISSELSGTMQVGSAGASMNVLFLLRTTYANVVSV